MSRKETWYCTSRCKNAFNEWLTSGKSPKLSLIHIYNKITSLITVLRDSFLDKKYEFVRDNKKQYFFDKEKYNFKTVEELEKYFQISHEKI